MDNPNSTTPSPGAGRRTLLVVFLTLLVLELGLQIASGVYGAERGVYADEAAHFTNGILIRDYVRTGIGQSPLQFAETFYLSFPKIALFMWPPLLHLVLGAVMLIPLPPTALSLFVMAALTAWIAFRAYMTVSELYGAWAGASVAVVFLGLKAVQDSATAVMADMLVAAMAIEAARHLAHYWETGRLGPAKLFGLFTGLACFAKGNGLVVILSCAILLVLTWKWKILLDRGIYWAAGITALLAGPFMVLSWYLYQTNSAFHPVTWERVRRFGSEYLGICVTSMGWVWAVAVLAGCIAVLIRQPRQPMLLSMFSLGFGTILFHSTTFQGTLTEPRYMVMGLAPLLALAPAGIAWAVGCIPALERRRGVAVSVAMGALALVFLGSVFSVLPRPPMGFRDAAKLLAGRIAPGELLLIASDSSGEGAFVSEFAAMEPRPNVYILRGTKILAEQDWMGNHFRMLYDSPHQALEDCEKMKIGYLLVDETPEMQTLPYIALARQAAEAGASRLERVAHYGSDGATSRRVAVYRLKHPAAGPRKPFRVNMKYSLGRSLER